MQDRPEELEQFDLSTRLQLESATLIRRSAELRGRSALAHQRFEAARAKVVRLKLCFEALKTHVGDPS